MTPNQINFKQIRKFLLFTGVASCCIGMLEASQEVVKALESRNLSLPFQAQPAENSAQQLNATQAQTPVSVPIAPTSSPAKPSVNAAGQAQGQTKPTTPSASSQQNAIAASAQANPAAKPAAGTQPGTPAPTGQTATQAATSTPGTTAAKGTAIATNSANLSPSAATAQKSSTKLQANLRAISTGAANDPQQAISQVAPTQIAANAWYGASFPVENFQEYTSPFGYRSSPTGGYSQEFHYGLDFAAPEGSYIRNWWSGKVVEVSDNSNCGTSVVVESGDWIHIYCHMQGYVESANGRKYMIDREGGVQVFEGQEVPAGTRIGRVGMTGRTTGPHLHWGLKYQEKWVDPALVLRAMYSSQQSTASR